MPNKTDSARAELERGFAELNIPEHLHGGLERYVLEGIQPGGFLCAVIDNDLRDAVALADDVADLKPLVQLFYNFAPGLCHGRKRRLAWQEKGGVAGKQEQIA